MSDQWAWDLLGESNGRAVQALVRPMLPEPEDSYGQWLEPASDPVYREDPPAPRLDTTAEWRTALIIGGLLAGVPALIALWMVTRGRR